MAPDRAGNARLQRLMDLLAALLARSAPATFEELARSVPEYLVRLEAVERETDPARRHQMSDSLKRAFERDKEELRAIGAPIEAVPDEDGNPAGAYRIRRTNFYLPYLCLAVPGGEVVTPPRVDGWGYGALTSLTFEPDELQAVVDAAALVRRLGDPLLTAQVDDALRKLAVDLPLDVVAAGADVPQVVLPRTRPDAAVFEALSEALTRRRAVTFEYHSMYTDGRESREVEPYGLFFLNGHWYLAARDRARGAVRNFRLNRITCPRVKTDKAQSADYEIPASFHLREHGRSRHPWELGDGEAVRAVVEFPGTSGPAMAAARLGEPVPGQEGARAFAVRRPEVFARWLLSFAGELVPVEPAELVTAWRDLAERTRALYAEERDGAAGGEESAASRTDVTRNAPAGVAAPVERWEPKGAAAQLRRILHLVPRLADGEEHSIAEIAGRIGADPDTVRRDLFSISARYGAPGGFVEAVELYLTPEHVSAEAPGQLRRPMRLTVSELCALELGLGVLRAQRPPDEHAVLDRARARLREVIARLPGDRIPDGLLGASLGEHAEVAHLAQVQEALRGRRKLRLVYRKSGSPAAAERVVSPLALVAQSGMLYLIPPSDEGASFRVFRLDRVEGAEVLAEGFESPVGFSLDQILRAGRVFIPDGEPPTMRVRYSPGIARWIAEREGRAPGADGAMVVEHPLADPEWGMRHVLQYGDEAEVLEPASLRARLRERLAAIAAGQAAGEAMEAG
jgi:predicted DNA-binding transcriptional regulator YafY